MKQFEQISLIKKYYQYHKNSKYTLAIVISILLMLVTMAISLVTPYIPRFALDKILPSKNYNLLWQLVGAIAIGLILREVSKYFYTTLLMSVKERVRLSIMTDLMRAIYNRSFKFFDSNQTGYLCSRILTDVSKLSAISLENLLNLFFSLLFVLAALGYLFWIDAFLATLIVFSISLGGGTTWFPKNKIKNKSLINSENWAQVNAKLQEKLLGIRTTKLFNFEHEEIKQFGNITQNAIEYLIKFNKEVTFYSKSIILVASFSLIFTLVFSFLKVMRGEMTLGVCISFFMYASMVYNLCTYIFVEFVQIRTTSGPLERVFNILRGDQEIEKILTPRSRIKMTTNFYSMKFEHVYFSYDGTSTEQNGKQLTLKDLSFEVKRGERVAIIGETGSGKTTIGKLAVRMYAPLKGKIFLDENEIQKIPVAILRKSVGLVTQNKFLFQDTILNNIKYGAPEATFEEVVRVSKFVKMHAFIDSLEKKYDTVLSELATNISEGQKQRITIARALIQKYKILIFDEITSHIDRNTEKYMIENINNHFPDTIQIYITHSLLLLKLVDRIVHIENGEIIEIGNHYELFESSAKYRRYYDKEVRKKSSRSFNFNFPVDEISI